MQESRSPNRRDDFERGQVQILIVEDSPTQAKRLEYILEENGFDVRMASNGKDALSQINNERPRIVITDVVMPEMNGYELCHQIKLNDKIKDIPVILLTSLSDPKDVLKGLECGANSFIVKPFESEYLLSRIRYVVANEELRKTESFKMGIEIFFGGQKYFITSDRVQILDLLLSSYESAVLRNSELSQVQEEMRRLNASLEIKVRERTEALGKSEEQYRMLFESSPLPMWVFDRETLSILGVNDAAVKHYGYSRNEFLNMTIKDLRPIEEIPKLMDFISEPTRDFRKSGIWKHRKKDGSTIEVEIVSHEIVWQERQARFVLANDITERKRAEALQSALYRIAEKTSLAEDMQEFYAAIHGIVSELMYAKNFYIAIRDDSEETISFPYFVDEVNASPQPKQAIRGLTGYVLRTGQSLLVSENDSGEMADRGEVETIGATSSYWLGVPLKTGDTAFGVLAVQSYSRDIKFDEREKEILRFVSQHVATAIERKHNERAQAELEKQLLQAQKMEAVGRLAGGVAHDFNNALMAINGYSELILLQIPENERFKKFVLEIQKAADQGAQLTRQLLAFSRKQVLSPKILDLNHSIKNIENMLQRLIGEDMELLTVLSKELAHVEADPGRIEQVIVNLVVNARDAMPQGGKITVETENIQLDKTYASAHAGVKPGRYVMLAISDTGCGMDEATVARIFEPFFTTKEEGKGTGLGLSTVYGIVKQSGGYIWVYSQLGQGTTFKIYFPRVDKELEDVNDPIFTGDVAGRGELILLVDDNNTVRSAVAAFLEMKGYRVLQASSGNEALDICRNEKKKIELLITDVVMPEMSGRELSRRLESEGHTTKILFMSGYTEEAVKRHGVLEAGTAFLQKPGSMDELLRKIRELLA